MPECIDLSGRKFGKLKILSRADNDSRGGAMWNCLCDCGNNSKVAYGNLKSGRIKNCRKCSTGANKLIDITGGNSAAY